MNTQQMNGNSPFVPTQRRTDTEILALVAKSKGRPASDEF